MSLNWLHISDFHLKASDPYSHDVVLNALIHSVARYTKAGRKPDLIFATGDIAHGGMKTIRYLLRLSKDLKMVSMEA